MGFGTIIIAGFAFAVAGGVSMFFSTYLSRRSELESLKIDMERERMEIETEPEEERAELEDLLAKEGYHREEVDMIMRRLMADKEMWLRAQLMHELRLHPEDLSSDSVSRPASAGLAFFLLAILALAPYRLLSFREGALVLSVSLALLSLFILSSRAFSPRNFDAVAGLKSAGVGALAAGMLYAAGLAFSLL